MIGFALMASIGAFGYERAVLLAKYGQLVEAEVPDGVNRNMCQPGFCSPPLWMGVFWCHVTQRLRWADGIACIRPDLLKYRLPLEKNPL